MLKRLVPITFGDSNQYWLMYEFRYHKGLTSIAIDNKMESFQDETNIISENQYHSIWKKDNKIIIELN